MKSKDVELAWVDGEIVMEKDVDKMVVKEEDKLKEEDEDMKGIYLLDFVFMVKSGIYEILCKIENLTFNVH